MWKVVILATMLLAGCAKPEKPDNGGIELVIKKCNEEHGQITMSYKMGGPFDTLTASCQFPKVEKSK